MRAFIFVSVICLANYYVCARLAAYMPGIKPHFIIPVLAALVLLGIEMLDLRTTFLQTYPALKLCISVLTGTIFCLIFYVLVADIVRLVTLPFPWGSLPKVTDAIFWGIVAVTAITVPIGAWQAVSGPRLREVDIRIANLPPAFENYKILQISDLHIGGTIRKPYVENVIAMANETNADLIALTGDFADGSVTELKGDSALLGTLKSKDGLYFITGNHEYYHDWGNWEPFYKSLGIHVMDNRHEVISRGDDKLVIAGVNDYSVRLPGFNDPANAARGMPQDAVKVLLMHQPTLYKDAEAAGFDLQLSGHTHGGQFFPYTMVVPFFHDFYKGLNRFGNLQIYISVGTGYWGPALRTFVPTEMTVLTLKRA